MADSENRAYLSVLAPSVEKNDEGDSVVHLPIVMKHLKNMPVKYAELSVSEALTLIERLAQAVRFATR